MRAEGRNLQLVHRERAEAYGADGKDVREAELRVLRSAARLRQSPRGRRQGRAELRREKGRDGDEDWGNHSHYNHLKKAEKTWFGYTVHLIADTEYELPVSFRVTKASESEVVNARGMIDDIGKDIP